MINWIIEWCARNRFLVFTGTFLLVMAGIWSLGHIPLDALPDISDVEVIIHTGWEGEPPNIIEDQVTYPIVSALLAAPQVKAVRAQTMFNDSYVFVIFEDGTDLYWARSSAACRTGGCAISLKPSMVWPRWQASADSFANIRSNSTPTSSLPTAFRFQP